MSEKKTNMNLEVELGNLKDSIAEIKAARSGKPVPEDGQSVLIKIGITRSLEELIRDVVDVWANKK